MAVNIADLLPSPVEITVVKGKPKMKLRHLELNEIVSLIFAHSNDFLAMYAESQEAKPNYIKFISLAPDLCATVIATAADDAPNAKEYRRLPFSVQLIALEEIWKVSVPDPKAFGEMLARLMTELKRLSEKAENADQNKPQ